MKRAVLVVSFGTSYKETREKTITVIENRIREAFPEDQIYCAFTSKMIKKKLHKEGIEVNDVTEAMEQMLNDGITDVLVQPTYIINGTEYDLMKDETRAYLDRFESISYGNPLLTKSDDYIELAHILHKEYPVDEDEVLVLMGHGSEHPANSAYPAFDYVLKDLGYYNILVGTVEGYPSFTDIKKKIIEINKKKVCLVPMMIVAGDHANNDMAGDEDSWKSELEADGFKVRYYIRGLGEICEVQDMLIKHAHMALEA